MTSSSCNSCDHQHISIDEECCNDKGNKDYANSLDVNITDVFSFAKKGNLEGCKKVVAKYGNSIFDNFNEEGYSLLHLACQGKSIDMLFFVLTKGSIVSFKDVEANKNSLNEIIKTDLNVVTKNNDLSTPIHEACKYGRLQIVDFLLKLGVSIENVDSKHQTPLFIVCSKANIQIAILLIAKGANVFAENSEQRTCLHMACQYGFPSLVMMLINFGLDPNKPDMNLQTPMHFACMSGDLMIVEAMISQKADINVVDNKGKTPKDIAKSCEFYTIEKYLIGLSSNKERFYTRFIKGRGIMFPRIFFITTIFLFLYFPFLQTRDTNYDVFCFLSSFALVFAIIFNLKNLWYFRPQYLERDLMQYTSYIMKCNSYETMKKIYKDNDLCHICCNVMAEDTHHCFLCGKCIFSHDDHDFLLDICINKAIKTKFILLYLLLSVFYMNSFIYFLFKYFFVFLALYTWPLCISLVRLFILVYSYKENISSVNLQMKILHRIIQKKQF